MRANSDNRRGNETMKAIVMFPLLAVFLYVGVNFALRPLVPIVAQYVPVLSPIHAIGLAGIVGLVLLFRK